MIVHFFYFYKYKKYENVVDIGECSVIIRMAGYKNYRKHAADILRAVGGKIGKPNIAT